MQYPQVMAATAAEFADRYLRGERGLPRRVAVAVDLVTSGNAASFQQ
jgi:ribose transport system substrate-binding protein